MTMGFNNGSNGMSPADFAALMGNNSNGFGGFGNGDGAWWLLVLIFALGGNFGNWGGNGGGAVPYMMTNNDVQNGFDQAAIMNGITALTSAVTTGFSNAEVSRCNAQTNLLQTMSNNQMGIYQTMNNNQNATIAALNQLASNQADCCCKGQLGLANLNATILAENCADRAAVSDGIRDIIANNTANTQALINNQNAGFKSIDDKLCQLELDGYKQQLAAATAEIATLKANNERNLQTAQILAAITGNNCGCNTGYCGNAA